MSELRFKTFSRLTSLVPAALLGVALAGCGGGGGAPVGPPAAAVNTVAGVASKGPLQGASLCAYAITGGSKGALIGSCVQSSATGAYTLDLGSYTGPVLLEATGGSYVDEATGTTVTLATPLRSVLINFTGGSTSAAVTALTELAYQLAAAKTGGLSTANVQAALATVQTNFGVTDILTTQPVDALALPATATAVQKAYTLALATLSQYLKAQPAGATLASALQTINACLSAAGSCGSLATDLASAMGSFQSAHSGYTGLGLPTTAFGGQPAGGGASPAAPTVSSLSPSTGPAGTTVTITGTHLGNFTPAPLVKFGTTVATVSQATATSITVTVPAGLAAGAVNITLSNFDGTAPLGAGSFTVAATSGGGAVGANWTSRNAAALGFTPNLRKLAWSGSQLVAVGGSGTCVIRTSPDGVTWTAQTLGTACTYLRDVAWSGSQFIAVGYVATSGGKAVVITSPDGVTWTARDSASSNNLQSVACSPGVCIAGGDNGTLRASTDGITWSTRGSGLNTSLSGVSLVGMTWTGSQWIGTGNTQGAIISSPDGQIWTLSSVGNAMYGWSSVASSGALSVVFGPTGPNATSTDGVAWTSNTSFYGFSFEAAAWTGNQFVAVGANGTVGTSSDGIHWTTQLPTPTVGLSGVVWTGSKIVAVGSNGILTSP